jgi:predicted membrane chloride channel (bestrophin family)
VRALVPRSFCVVAKVWVFLLPFVLVPSLHMLTLPMSTTMAFFIYKLDEISAELQVSPGEIIG